MHIERARLEDVETIRNINTLAFNDEMNRVLGRDGGPPGYNEIEEHQSLIQKFLVYKIVNTDRVIGSFFLVNRGEAHYSLESFCILPECQGKGFGYKTLELMVREHPEVKKWSLGSFKKSKRIWKLYEKFGFIRIGEDEWEYNYEMKIS
jgi:ribosomal protein S18 acetylase RimI-like enzyme